MAHGEVIQGEPAISTTAQASSSNRVISPMPVTTIYAEITILVAIAITIILLWNKRKKLL